MDQVLELRTYSDPSLPINCLKVVEGYESECRIMCGSPVFFFLKINNRDQRVVLDKLSTMMDQLYRPYTLPNAPACQPITVYRALVRTYCRSIIAGADLEGLFSYLKGIASRYAVAFINNEFYRVELTGKLSVEGIEVLCIDHGTRMVTDAASLFPMAPCFTQQSRLALPCCLKGFPFFLFTDEGREMEYDTMTQRLKLFENHDLLATFERHTADYPAYVNPVKLSFGENNVNDYVLSTGKYSSIPKGRLVTVKQKEDSD